MAPGDVVRVPFGRREVKGVVFEIDTPPKVEHSREIIRVADGGPFISSHGLALARWVATYYRSTLFTAAATMLPPGGIDRLREWITKTEVPLRPLTGLRTREQRAMKEVEAQGSVTKESLGRKLGRGGVEVVEWMVRRGFLESEYKWEPPTVKAKYREVVTLAVPVQDAMDAAEELERGRATRQGQLLKWLLANDGRETRSELARRFGQYAVRAALDKGLTKARTHTGRARPARRLRGPGAVSTRTDGRPIGGRGGDPTPRSMRPAPHQAPIPPMASPSSSTASPGAARPRST